MKKIKTMDRLLLLVLSVYSSLTVSSVTAQPVIELLNNSENTIFVGTKPVQAHKTLEIPFDNHNNGTQIFTIKDSNSKCFPTHLYRIYYKNDTNSLLEDSSLIKMDFRTIRFIARAEKKQSGYDEISVHNDTPYDILLNFVQNNICNPHNTGRTKTGIIVEPGNTFHKTIYYINSNAGKKNLKTLGLLLFSVMSAQNKGAYSIRYPSRVYSREALVGCAGWKSKTIMASTIKLFNEHFAVEYM